MRRAKPHDTKQVIPAHIRAAAVVAYIYLLTPRNCQAQWCLTLKLAAQAPEYAHQQAKSQLGSRHIGVADPRQRRR